MTHDLLTRYYDSCLINYITSLNKKLSYTYALKALFTDEPVLSSLLMSLLRLLYAHIFSPISYSCLSYFFLFVYLWILHHAPSFFVTTAVTTQLWALSSHTRISRSGHEFIKTLRFAEQKLSRIHVYVYRLTNNRHMNSYGKKKIIQHRQSHCDRQREYKAL